MKKDSIKTFPHKAATINTNDKPAKAPKTTKTPPAAKVQAPKAVDTAKAKAWEVKKAADAEAKKPVPAQEPENRSTRRGTKAPKVKTQARISAEEIVIDAVNEVLGRIPTRREKIAEEDAVKAEEAVAAMKRIPGLFALPKKAAQEVADLLVGVTFDVLGNLTPDDLMAIKGIGPKYAEIILSTRWEVTGKLVKAESYEVEVEPSAPTQKERLVWFDPDYNPNRKMSPVQSKDINRRESELDRHMKDMGYEPYDLFITVVGYIPSIPGSQPTAREMRQKDFWSKWCSEGFFARGGRKFVPVEHGTNAGRKDKVQFVRSDVKDAVEEFTRNGAVWGARSTEAKEAGYMGLCMPGTIRIEDYLGLDIKPEDMAITPSYKKVFRGQHVDFVDVATGTVSINVVRDVVQNMFDGQNMIHLSSKKLAEYLKDKSPEEKRRICGRLNKAKSFTIRGPWIKGLTLTVCDFHAVLRKLGVKKILCADGRVMDLEDVVILADESVFKASVGETGCHFRSWAEYCQNWHRLGHHFCVLIKEHADKPHTLPFQQLQSMVGGRREDLDAAINAEIAKLKSYSDPTKAAGLVGGDMAKIVTNVPGLHAHPWVMNREQAVYDKLCRQARGGVLHGTTHNCFVGADLIAMCQWVAYAASDISADLQAKGSAEDYVTGAVSANSVICALNEKGTEAVMSRNPSTDPAAQCVVNVQKDFGEWSWAMRWSTTVFTSVNSIEVTKIRGDHDGDHVAISFVAAIINMAKEANRIHGGRLIEWVAPSTEKHPVFSENMPGYFASLTQQSQLGHWCDMLTSLVGFGLVGYNHAVACWLTMAVNVFVDAAKHGMDEVTVPEFVLEFLRIKDKDGNVVLDENGLAKVRPMPIYAMQAKDNAHPAKVDKKVGSKRCATKYGVGNGDLLAHSVQLNVPAVPKVALAGLPEFELKELLYSATSTEEEKVFGLRGCDELFARGTYNKELGVYENQGLWKELCFERMHELKALQDSFADPDEDRLAYNETKRSAEQFRRYMGIRRLREWAEANGKTMEDVYDAITYYTFRLLKYPVLRQNESNAELEKRVQIFDIMFEGWIKILGGMALRAIYMRDQAKAAGTLVDEDFDLDDSFMEDFA